MDSGESLYIHGTHAEEQRRLAKLNELLNRRSIERLGLRRGQSVLDIGCGLGQLTVAMAEAVGPDGRVVGIERSAEQLEPARVEAADAGLAVDFRRGDAHDPPLSPDEQRSFDVAHARFILEHVDDPLAVVRGMVRAVKPGGRIILEDDDHDVLRLYPPPAGFEELWRAYTRAYERIGRDPYVGRHLISLLHRAGASPRKSDWLPFGSCAGEESFAPLVENFIGIIESARNAILSGGDVDARQLDAALDSFRRWSHRPDATMWYATCWAEGVVPNDAHEKQPETAGHARSVATSRAEWSDRHPDLTSDRSMLRLLVDTAEDLTSTLDLDAVFRRTARRVKRIVDCQLFCVLLWNEETEFLEHSYSTCYDVPMEIDKSGAFPMGYGLCGHAALDRKTIRVDDVLEDPRYVRYRHPEVEIRSELTVPLLSRGRLIGVIDLESTSVGTFTAEHERLLTALASQVAIALDNARLHRRVVAGEQRLEADLSTACEIQKALLPAAPPRLDGVGIGASWAPARDLGGDFYDFMELDEHRRAIVVGDVSGKGAAAALYGAMVVGLLRGQLGQESMSPARMLSLLSEQLLQQGLDNRFVALALAVIDTDKRVLTIANGGLPPPILVRDGSAEALSVTGMPLGLIEGASYQHQNIELRDGDLIALCSDGIQDSSNALGEPFGTHRTLALLERIEHCDAQAIADRLLATTDMHAGRGCEHFDDRTAVVICVG